jgi:hypothetical protein
MMSAFRWLHLRRDRLRESTLIFLAVWGYVD